MGRPAGTELKFSAGNLAGSVTAAGGSSVVRPSFSLPRKKILPFKAATTLQDRSLDRGNLIQFASTRIVSDFTMNHSRFKASACGWSPVLLFGLPSDSQLIYDSWAISLAEDNPQGRPAALWNTNVNLACFHGNREFPRVERKSQAEERKQMINLINLLSIH